MKKLVLSIALLLSVILVSANNETSKNDIQVYVSNYITNVNSFCKLIQMGDYDAVKSLIEEGVDVNQRSTGLTALMFAARHNKAEIAELLIEHGAKLNAKSDKGFTALKYAEISNAKEAYAVIEKAMKQQKMKKNKRRNS